MHTAEDLPAAGLDRGSEPEPGSDPGHNQRETEPSILEARPEKCTVNQCESRGLGIPSQGGSVWRSRGILGGQGNSREGTMIIRKKWEELCPKDTHLGLSTLTYREQRSKLDQTMLLRQLRLTEIK